MVIRRRDVLLGAASALALPRALAAQQPAQPVIGFLDSAWEQPFAANLAAFRDGLGQAGYAEGRNYVIESRWAEGDLDRLAPLAADLIARHVSVISASGGPAPALTAKGLTSTIPIVFTIGADPVALGLVPSLAHPGGNITGVTFLTSDLGAKRLELLRELVPNRGRIAVLINPGNPSAASQRRDIESAARTLRQEIVVLSAASPAALGDVLARLPTSGTAALLVGADPLFLSRREQITARASELALPTMYELREFAEVGGLISYGASVTEAYRLSGVYVGRVLKGEKPSELPIVRPTKFEMIVNLKTAKQLGLAMPQFILARADEVME